MSVGVNPLVVAKGGGGTNAWSGVYLAEDIQLLHQGVKSGSWVDLTLGGVGAALDTLGLITDPLGTLATWGVAWLLDHVKPLKEALDQLAGDPAQISANAQTWRNVADQMKFAAGDYRNAVSRQTAAWTGEAGDAYRTQVAEHEGGMKALSEAAETMASVVEGSGMLVALVRTLVRDAIAEFVSILAVRLPEWLAEVGLTIGIGTPWVIGQVTSLVAKWVNKIKNFLRGLLNSLRRLREVLGKLRTLVENIMRKLRMHGRVGLDKWKGHFDAPENLISSERLKHILTGDGKFSKWWDGKPGGGHLWPGLKGKTPFPKHWTVEDIKRYVSDIATDPNAIKFGVPNDGRLFSNTGKPLRFRYYGTRDGVQIRVVVEPGGEGITTRSRSPVRRFSGTRRSCSMSTEDPYRRLAERLRAEVPGEIVDVYESYLNEVEQQLALEELFDGLEAAAARISVESAQQLWKLARSWGITRFTEAEVNALAGR